MVVLGWCIAAALITADHRGRDGAHVVELTVTDGGKTPKNVTAPWTRPEDLKHPPVERQPGTLVAPVLTGGTGAFLTPLTAAEFGHSTGI
jgi:hypothetical protein